MTNREVKRRITRIFRRHMTAPEPESFDILPKKLTSGKLYEAYVLAMVSHELASSEGYELRLVNDEFLPLQSAPSPISRSRPRVELRKSGQCRAEMWTDVEFLSLSYSMRGGGPPERGEYHELDIAIVEPGLDGRPTHDKIWLAVECKNTGYNKGLLKEILGIRRELSLLSPGRMTAFQSWPRGSVPADPPSCVVVYCTDGSVMDYAKPGETFGIDFRHVELIL
jgi:hypothetical protein